MVEKNKKDTRVRVWSAIVYPESAPENWRDVLDKDHLAWVESPLHDKDVNPDGEVKKPHWHIMMFFDGKKSFEQIKEITDSINCPIPQAVKNPKGMARYLIHMDNPEKYQYEKDKIVCHGGIDIDSYFELSASSRSAVLNEIYAFILDSEIENFADFIRYCLDNEEYDWLDISSNRNTMSINKLIDAVYQKKHAKEGRVSDETSLDKKILKVKELKEKGLKNTVIADTVGISLATVKRYLKK